MAGIFSNPSPSDEHVRAIVVRRRAAASPEKLACAIHAARAWLGPETGPAPPGMRRHEATLRLRVSDRPSLVSFHKEAYVDIGPVQALNDGWEAAISWRASSMAPLFPVFSGRITARSDELTLSGWYAPPGGTLGRLADGAVLKIAAKATARWLLRELDDVARGPAI